MNKRGVITASELFGTLIILILWQLGSAATTPSALGEFTSKAPTRQTAATTETEDSEGGSDMSPVSLNPAPPNAGGLADATESAVAARQLTLKHVVQLVALVSVFLLGYSLLMTGKHGRGWFVMAVIIGVVTTIGKGFLSLFVEVTNTQSTKEWDEED